MNIVLGIYHRAETAHLYIQTYRYVFVSTTKMGDLRWMILYCGILSEKEEKEKEFKTEKRNNLKCAQKLVQDILSDLIFK